MEKNDFRNAEEYKEEQKIRQNKHTITGWVLLSVLAPFSYILMTSTYNGSFFFRRTYNQNTGELHSVFTSLVAYFLLWFVVEGIAFACVFLVGQGVYCFLHRKDKRFLQYGYHPKYETEYTYSGVVALLFTCIATIVIFALHISGIITLNL